MEPNQINLINNRIPPNHYSDKKTFRNNWPVKRASKTLSLVLFLLQLGDALTQTDDSDESSIRHCICTRPQCWTKSDFCVAKYDVKWWSCNCTKSYVIECHEGVLYGFIAFYVCVN